MAGDVVLPPARLVDGDSPAAALFNATRDWIGHQKSSDTRVAYQRGLLGVGKNGGEAKLMCPAWLPWLAAQGIHPLQVRIGTVDDYGRALAASGMADRSCALRLSTVSSWYDWLIAVELTDRNPAAHATRPTIDSTESATPSLTVDELQKLLAEAAAHSPMAFALILVLYLNAFRIGGVLECNLADLQRDAGEHVLRMRVKGSVVRRLVLEPEGASALLAYLATRPDAKPGDPMWVGPRGGRIDNPGVWRLLEALCARAGVTRISSHGLRHTHVDHALDADVPLMTIRDTLGHASIITTDGYKTRKRKRGNRSGTRLAELLGDLPGAVAS
jgi:integrase/recombinase XerD